MNKNTGRGHKSNKPNLTIFDSVNIAEKVNVTFEYTIQLEL